MTENLPAKASMFAERYPEIWKHYSALGKASAESGPLDKRDQRLAKLAFAIAARSEGATHSHTRRALDEGISADEIRHVAALAVTTLGFPNAVAGLTWIDDVLNDA